MLLLTVIYDETVKDLCEDIGEIKSIFELKNIKLGISETINNKNHFVKIFCKDNVLKEQYDDIKLAFDLYLANVLYKLAIKEFCINKINKFLNEKYYFLNEKDITLIKFFLEEFLIYDNLEISSEVVFCINRKNNIIKKVLSCIEDVDELNINGFLRFRTKEFLEELGEISDKIMEKYIRDREYIEFIKMLRLFVDSQEPSYEEINLIIDNRGNYILKNKNGQDLIPELLRDIEQSQYSGMVNMEDIIISGLVTHVPKRVVIHCAENCYNKEFIDTIKDVFLERAHFCDECSFCKEYIMSNNNFQIKDDFEAKNHLLN
ncbi:MAG: putative sporulation protein YtxC [Clostridium sp.]